MITCPNCGQENPDGARFCNACAAPLTAEPTGAREERKVVSVLFADLVGFTSQAEQLDPEDVRAILSGYHERVRFELERYGGTVEKFIGDAVMAIFGAPVAREDDPERAVRAALAAREAIAELNDGDGSRELHVRVGITTGETLVRLDARPEEGEGMAAGDVVNTAARLQSAAPTDGILVDETTYRATERIDRVPRRGPGRCERQGRARFRVRGHAGPRALRRRRSADRPHAARRSGARARCADSCARPCANGARAAARDARRRARDRQESPRVRALPRRPGRARAHHLASGPLTPVRRGRVRSGRSPRSSRRRRASSTPMTKRGCSPSSAGRSRDVLAEQTRGRMGRAQPSPARGARRGVRARCRPPRRGVLGVAPLLRGDGGVATARARLRRSPLRRRRSARLRRLPRRLGDRCPAARDRYGPSGAARAAARLGRRQGKRAHALPLVALGHGDRADRARAARPGRAAGRPPAAAARAGGGQPALRRRVRAARGRG